MHYVHSDYAGRGWMLGGDSSYLEATASASRCLRRQCMCYGARARGWHPGENYEYMS
jgi:hypothetical protein